MKQNVKHWCKTLYLLWKFFEKIVFFSNFLSSTQITRKKSKKMVLAREKVQCTVQPSSGSRTWFKHLIIYFGIFRQGDSGGPFTVPDNLSRPVIIGLTSFGISLGCELGYPSVFTRITSYLDWISLASGIEISP